MVPGNSVLDRAPCPPWQGEIRESEPPVCSDVAYCQITLALVTYIIIVIIVIVIKQHVLNHNVTPQNIK